MDLESSDTDEEPGWVELKKGRLPTGAVEGGKYGGEKLYIGRTMLDGCWIPGSYYPSENALSVPWSKEHKVTKNLHILVHAKGSFIPLPVKDEIPKGSVTTGECAKDEDIFIGRVNHEGNLIVGRISVSKGACFIPYKGKELAFSKKFEIYNIQDSDEEYELSDDEDDEEPGWVDVKRGKIPKGAVEGGYMGDDKLYIGRGMYDGCWIPGSIRPTENVLRVAYKKKEIMVERYQILVHAKGTFVPLKEEIPKGSVSTGNCTKDDDIFIGRAKYKGCLIIGRISPSGGACYIAYNGREVPFTKNFEIFTIPEPEE